MTLSEGLTTNAEADLAKRVSKTIALLEVEVERLWEENMLQKLELGKVSTEYTTVVALKDAKIDELEKQLCDAAQKTPPAIEYVAVPPLIVNETTYHAFRMHFTGVSALRSNLTMRSKPARMAGADWEIAVKKSIVEKKGVAKEYMKINLNIISQIPDGMKWGATKEFCLHAQDLCTKEKGIVHKKSYPAPVIYTKENHNWGVDFVILEDLFLPVLSYVMNDAMMLTAEIRVFPLQ